MTQRSLFVSTLVAAAVFSAPRAATAQYFGRNKVQYEKLDFHVLVTPHYRIHFYPEAASAIEDAARMAERWYERDARTFEHEIAQKRPLILYADHPDFEQTNILSGQVGEGTGGVTEGMQDRIILPLGNSYGDTNHVLGHEIVHSFQFDIASGNQGAGLQGLLQVPLWFIEGMAEYMSLGPVNTLTGMWLRDALLHDDFPTLEDMTKDPNRYFPYRFGHAFWAYVASRYGDVAVTNMMRNAARAGWSAGVARVIGMSPDTLSANWKAAMEARYRPLMEGRTPPGEAGTLLLSPETGAGHQNLAPSLSPDGRYVAYLSEQDLFTYELYLADARTGEVLRAITSATRDAHFDALRFLDSSGAWSPDGSTLAVIVYAEGRNRIQLYRVDGSRDRVIDVPATIGEIRMPSYSPDGTKIVFSGQAGGVTDLYTVDVQTGDLTQLTADKYSQLEPTYSPDGKSVAFVTDLGPETNFDELTFGEMAIAIMDLDTGDTRRLVPLGEGVAYWNPQFTPDGEGLYFLADPDGFRDIYRLGLSDGTVWQVTRLVTGVSGVTDATPALSVAARTGTVAFTVFDDSEYHVYALDAVESEGSPLAPRETVAESAARLAGAAPAGGDRVSPLLANPDIGLVPPGTYSTDNAEEYDASLHLTALGQPAIGVGTDQFGTFIGGSVAAMFSDLLGDRNLYTAIQAQGEVKDIGGQVFYQNLGRRWNWGAGVSHIPYRYLFQGYGDPTPEGAAQGATYSIRRQDYRIFNTQAVGQLAYPFSAIRRAELSLSFTRQSYDLEEYIWNLNGNFLVGNPQRVSGDVPAPVNLAEASVAYVEDNSFSAFTGPVRGFRSRIEVGEARGTVNFTSVLADIRRYYSPFQELTFAVRAFHYGRYGINQADSQILRDIYLGDEYLMRGYSAGSFDVNECTQTPDGTCAEYDRLLGQRVGVVNLEARVPVLGTERFGLISFPYLPTDFIAFVDAGVAWNQGAGAKIKWDRNSTERIPVVSTGVSARMNLFGALVLEVYYAYPFQRPQKGAYWGVSFLPGW